MEVYIFPKEKTALTQNIWPACWLIILSFVLKAFWKTGFIHASHAFFISGNVLLTLLIATRVLQSHGPKNKNLENLKILHVVSGLIVTAGVIRVRAYLVPASYFHLLGCSSLVLTTAVLLWAYRYLRFINIY